MVFVKRPLALMLIASTPFGLSQTAMAQDSYDDDEGWFEWSDDEIDSGDYEYEAGEGWHEEEWYDPSDWFDDDYNDDYWSYDNDDDWADDDMYVGDNPTDYYEWTDGYDQNWHGYSGYYDGYVDGYYDDEFGSDYWDTTWVSPYRSSYTSGYYDGYYDSINEYNYDPTYYYTNGKDDQNSASDRNRRGDEMRDRGDRMRDRSGNWNRSGMDGTSKQRGMDTHVVRRRGTVESLSSADVRDAPDGHNLMRIQLENGKTILADFGPNMSRSRLPFSEGDRVTICGERKTSGSKDYLKVHKVRSGDETVRLRPGPYYNDSRSSGEKSDMRRNDSRQRSNERQGRSSDGSWSGQTTLSGRIEDVWRSARDVSGQALYRVEMSGGKTVVLAVDGNQADKLRMREGDRVRIEGEKKRLGGRKVIDLQRIRSQSATGRSD